MKSSKTTSEKQSTGSTLFSNLSDPQPESPAKWQFPKIQYRGHNNYDQAEASEEAAWAQTPDGPGESLTVQAMAEDADINVLMRRYGITGKMPENPRIPSYGDFTNITDYRGALHAVREAEEGFMEIPAEIRAKFNNDPQQYLEFCDNPANLPQMRELGLAKPLPYQEAPPPPKQGTAAAPAAPPVPPKVDGTT